MNSDPNKQKYKKPKQRTETTTNPGTSRPRNRKPPLKVTPEPNCPLLAKDSEWVDILDTASSSIKSSDNVLDEEEVLQLVDCEDGPEMKPLAIMFPGLLDKDPQTLEGVLNRAMSTTEVTRHLVDLGQKANFAFMKKADRLIPPDKQWMESLTENSNSGSSVDSHKVRENGMVINSPIINSSDYDADCELTDQIVEQKLRKKKKYIGNPNQSSLPPICNLRISNEKEKK